MYNTWHVSMQHTSLVLAKHAERHLCIKAIYVEVNDNTVCIRDDMVVGKVRRDASWPERYFLRQAVCIHAVRSFVAAGN